MEIANRPYGRVLKGHTVPYGTLADASYELRKTYYTHGWLRDEDIPELPCLELDGECVDPEEVLVKHELHDVMAEMLDSLTPREAKVLRMRFGIELPTDYTLEEVGKQFDVTRERIRQIEAKALRKLKHPSRVNALRAFVPTYEIKTTADRKRETEAAQRRWQEDHEKKMQRAQEKAKPWARKDLEEERAKLWQEIGPMVREPGWIEYLRVNDPAMYQRLEQMVNAVWGPTGKNIWNKYAKAK